MEENNIKIQKEIIDKLRKKYSQEEIDNALPFIMIKFRTKNNRFLSGNPEVITQEIEDVILLPTNFKHKTFEFGHVLSDIYGNTLLTNRSLKYKKDSNEVWVSIKKCTDNDFLVTKVSHNEKVSKHFKYDNTKKEFESETDLSQYEIMFPTTDKQEIAVLKKNNKYMLYSFKQKRIISPEVDSLELVSDENEKLLFKFADHVESILGKEENPNIDFPRIISLYDRLQSKRFGPRIKDSENMDSVKKKITTLIGFITEDGIMYDGVYDEYFNQVRTYELNDKPDFVQYIRLKNCISNDLDHEVEKEMARKESSKVTQDNFYKKVKTFTYEKKD